MACQWWRVVASTSSTLMTMGITPITRGSRAATSQAVQARLEPPETTKPSSFNPPPASLARYCWTAVIAAVPLLTIGKRSNWVASRVALFANFACW